MSFSAGLAHPSWSSRNIALLQGTIGLRVDSGASRLIPWRFILLDFDRELDLDYPFDWSPCYKSNSLTPPVPFSWHLGATLLDLDRTTAAENETRWIQVRAGLVARMLPLGFNSRRGPVGAQIQWLVLFGCSGMGGGIYLRCERQWTEIEQNRHSLDRLLVGMHVGLIDSDAKTPFPPR